MGRIVFKWTVAELETLRTRWTDNQSNEYLIAALPFRTLEAITCKAAELGLGPRDRRFSPKDSIWTEALTAELRVRWQADMPVRQIAGELSVLAGVLVNKNMVISRSKRAGVEQHKAASMAIGRNSRMMAMQGYVGMAGRIPEHPPHGHCCYPSGDVGNADFQWCGAPAREEGGPYCAPHHAKTHRVEREA